MGLKVKDKSKLFDETYYFLCEQYRKANPLRFILLVGVDDKLSYDLANYILGHRYQSGCLQCVDYLPEIDIVGHISQMRRRTVLLLRGLEKASQVALIPIIRKIEGVIYDPNETPKPLVIEGERTIDGNSITVPCDEFGTLIINTRDPNILPEYVKKHFEVISHEPAKQAGHSTPANTQQDTAGREDLGFTYNKQSHALALNGKGMKLSKKRAELFVSLKKPRNIRRVLKELYSEHIERDEKVIDNKSVSFYSFVSKFNKSWRNHFKLNEELELIKCKDEIVSIVQKIDWK